MKIVVKIILFLILINIFIPMVKSLNIFDAVPNSEDTHYNLEDGVPDESQVFEDIAEVDPESLFASSSMEDLGILLGSLFLGGIVALITHSIAPIAISLFIGTFLNIYRNSMNIVGQLDINPYIVLAFTLSILVLVVYTIIEYMTQGDASDS